MTERPSDIISQLRSGNEEVFRRIFEQYFSRIVFFIKEYVSDYELAREISQDTFMKLWEMRTTLREDSNLYSLLLTLSRNRALNFLKHRLVEQKHIKLTHEEYHRAQLNYCALKDTAAEPLHYKELEERIKSAIDSLPPRCREIFLFSRFEELKYKEIADRLTISVKTVENQISEALKRLHKLTDEF